MNQFTGQTVEHFYVYFPESIWEMVSSEEWQGKFFRFNSKPQFAKWIARQDRGTDFSRVDGFYGVEGAEEIRVVPYLSSTDID